MSRGLGGAGEGKWTPVSTEKDGGRADMEKDDGVPWTDIVVDGPANSVSTLIGEVDGDANLAASASSRGRGGGEVVGVARRGGVVDLDGGELRVVGIYRVLLRIHL